MQRREDPGGGILGGGNCKGRGPQVGADLARSRNSKAVLRAGAERTKSGAEVKQNKYGGGVRGRLRRALQGRRRS